MPSTLEHIVPLAPRRSDANAPRSPLFARAVFALDRRLRESNGIFCFTSDPSCLFRISFAQLRAATVLSNGIELDAGCPIVELHIWNEQLPILTQNASPIAWGLRMSRGLERSLRLLSSYLRERPGYDGVRAAQADMAFGTNEQTAQLLRICGRYGFVPAASAEEEGFAHRIGQNILISMLVLASNAAAWRLSTFRRDRVRVFLTREELDRRFRGRDEDHPPVRDSRAS